MNIKEFSKKYEKQLSETSPFKRWEAEKSVDDYLGTTVYAGVTIGDLLHNGSLRDKIDSDTFKAFNELMNDKADSFEEIRSLIIEKSTRGDSSVAGLLSKIQGQLGENVFVENIGAGAELAKSGSQAGWDVKIPGDTDQFVQVKIYNDANGVIRKMEEVNECIANNEYGEVTSIDFAVNSDIFEEVKQKASSLGMPNEILNVGATRDELRGLLATNFEDIKNYSGLENFFGEVLGGSLVAGGIHAAINGFFVWKGVKEFDSAIEDTIYSTTISTGGISAAMIVEDICFFAGPLAGVIAIGAGAGARSVLKRLSLRRYTVANLMKSNLELSTLCTQFEAL